MTKISRLGALFVYLSLGAPLAASCARATDTADPTLGLGAGGSKTTAGGKATAGANAVAGGNALAGSNGSAFGGANAQGGNAVSGTTATAGAGRSLTEGGESGAVGGAPAGGGGSDSVPPDVLMRASALVLYRTSETTASSQKIQMNLNIKNQSPDPLPMAHVKIRYWCTAEITPDLHNYFAAANVTPVKTVFVDAGDDSYALLTFADSTGVILQSDADVNKSEIQLDLATSSGAFDQSDDFSWDPSASLSKPNAKITMYLDDKLIWGCEPSGQCFDDDTSGQGGAGGLSEGGQSAVGQSMGGQAAGGQAAGGQAAGGQAAGGQAAGGQAAGGQAAGDQSAGGAP